MENKLISKVFLWMTIGLLTTFITGYIVSINERMLYSIFATNLYWVFLISELILVIVLSARIPKMKPITAQIWFIIYLIKHPKAVFNQWGITPLLAADI